MLIDNKAGSKNSVGLLKRFDQTTDERKEVDPHINNDCLSVLYLYMCVCVIGGGGQGCFLF